MSIPSYSSPSKTSSGGGNPTGTYIGIVTRYVNPDLYIKVPRLAGDFEFGPVPFLGPVPAVDETVFVSFIEGRVEEMAVVSGNLSYASGGGVLLNEVADVTLTAPADTEVLTYDSGSGEWINAPQLMDGYLTLTFDLPGNLSVGTGTLRLPATRTMEIQTVRAMVDTAPTGASVIFDINLNGVSIYPTAAKPTILAGANDSGYAVPDTLVIPAGDYLQIDIDQVGSTVPGANAVLVIEVVVAGNAVVPASLLTDIGDVTISAPASGEFLSWDGSNWVNSIVSGAGVQPEGTSVLSTGETGGTKFLREDGDGTSSWIAIPGGGDMLASANLSDLVSKPTSRTNLGVDAAGTDNSTNVTLSGTGTYLTLVGQDIQVDRITESDIIDLNHTIAAIGNITDVTLTTIASGEILKWDGAGWVNNTLSEAGISGTSHAHSAPSVDDLNDVTITGIANGEVLRWNGSAWVNNTLAELGVDPAGTDNSTDVTLAGTGTYISLVGQAITVDPITESDISDLTHTTALEGTAILSTGEIGGTKFLREDGDGTSSWQVITGGGDMLAANNLSEVDPATARTNLNVDIAGTDNSTPVTFIGTGTYLALTGQEITVDPITESDISDLGAYITGITGEPLSDLSDVTITTIAAGEVLKWNGTGWINNTLAELGVDPAGTDNSTDVTFAGTGTYISLAGQVITVDPITESDISDLSHTPEGTAVKSTGETGGLKYLREDGDGTSSWQPVSAGSPEGTTVLSTGETGASKFLREDGDGTSSWQAITGGGDMLAANNLSDLVNKATARTNLVVDIAGTDNSTNVSLAGTGTYLSLVGQVLTVDPITESDISDLAHTPEGTAIKSTGEVGGTKYLREDGDGTSSWQTVAAGASAVTDLTDVTITTIAAGEVLKWDGAGWINNTLAELGVDPAGTDNSVNVSLAGTGTYVSLIGQVLTVDPITESDISDLGAYITGITGEPLSDLSDVTITTIASGEILKWNGSAWINNTLAEASISDTSHNHTLDGLSNTTITAIASGELLKWNGSAWINNTLAEAAIAAAVHTHVETDVTDLAHTTANVSTALSTGTVTATTYGITSDGGTDDVVLAEATTTLSGILGAAKWNEIVANTAKVGVTTQISDITGEPLSDLSDVTITTIASGEVLKWSGTAWINNTLAEAGIASTSHAHALNDVSDVTITTATAGDLLQWNSIAWVNVQAASTHVHTYDPLTTKGDLFTFDTDAQRLAIGTNDYVLTADSAEATGMKWSAPKNSLTHLSFDIPGTLAVSSGTLRIPIPSSMSIQTVRAAVNTAPTGASIIFDINKNGTSIYPTSAKPTIAASAFDSGSAVPDTTALVAGDYLQIDIDQIGSTIAGADAVIIIEATVSAGTTPFSPLTDLSDVTITGTPATDELLGYTSGTGNWTNQTFAELNLLSTFSGGVIQDVVAWDNSFANRAGSITPYDFTGRELLIIEGGNGSLTDARINVHGASDSSLPNYIQLTTPSGGGIRINGGDLEMQGNAIVETNTPGLVRGHAETSSFVTINTSATTLASSTIVIPTEWTTYDVECWWMHRIGDTSGGGGVSGNITTSAYFNGTQIGLDGLLEFSSDNSEDNQHISGNGYLLGQTVTGSRAIRLDTIRAGDPTCRAAGNNLIVHAYRVT